MPVYKMLFNKITKNLSAILSGHREFLIGLVMALMTAFAAPAVLAMEIEVLLDPAKKQLLEEDLRRLEVSDTIADQWLKERVSILVGESFNLWKSLRASNTTTQDHNFENPEKHPLDDPTPVVRKQPADERVLIVNAGIYGYRAGKEDKTLYGVQLTPNRRLFFSTPRVGLIKIKDILFTEPYLVNKENSNSSANSIYRLSVLLHDGRHSDGNGYSLGFAHVRCPFKHDFQGTFNCDLATNGAYAKAAEFLSNAITNCQDCSASELETLRLVYIDNRSRILPFIYKNNKKVFEKMLEQARLNSILLVWPASDTATIKSYQDSLAQVTEELARLTAEKVLASDWDEKPEGTEPAFQEEVNDEAKEPVKLGSLQD